MSRMIYCQDPHFRQRAAEFMVEIGSWPRRGPLAAGWWCRSGESRNGEHMAALAAASSRKRALAEDGTTGRLRHDEAFHCVGRCGLPLVCRIDGGGGASRADEPARSRYPEPAHAGSIRWRIRRWRIRRWLWWRIRVSAALLLCAALQRLRLLSTLLERARLPLTADASFSCFKAGPKGPAFFISGISRQAAPGKARHTAWMKCARASGKGRPRGSSTWRARKKPVRPKPSAISRALACPLPSRR